jgi:hypothetical protein
MRRRPQTCTPFADFYAVFSDTTSHQLYIGELRRCMLAVLGPFIWKTKLRHAGRSKTSSRMLLIPDPLGGNRLGQWLD